ncbi:hypothetical protein Bca101_031921 [Brassica carinata]
MQVCVWSALFSLSTYILYTSQNLCAGHLTEAEEPEDIFQLHGELEAKSLGAPGTCVAELVFNTSLTGFVLFDLQLEAWILDGVGVEQDGREEMELVQKLEKRDR